MLRTVYTNQLGNQTSLGYFDLLIMLLLYIFLHEIIKFCICKDLIDLFVTVEVDESG